MTDWNDDDFVDIIPARLAGKKDVPLRIGFTYLGKHLVPRIALLFAPSVLDEIGGPRFAVQFNARARVLRVRAGDDLPYEAVRAPRGEIMMIRCPVPPGLHPDESKGLEPEFYVHAERKIIDIEIPEGFGAVKLIAPPRPAPINKAAPSAKPDVVDDLPVPRPRAVTLSGVAFTSQEGDLLRLLAKRDLVTKDAAMMATAEPGADDERDEKLADVLIHKIRKKIEPIGYFISTIHGEGWRIPRELRAKLARMIEEADAR